MRSERGNFLFVNKTSKSSSLSSSNGAELSAMFKHVQPKAAARPARTYTVPLLPKSSGARVERESKGACVGSVRNPTSKTIREKTGTMSVAFISQAPSHRPRKSVSNSSDTPTSSNIHDQNGCGSKQRQGQSKFSKAQSVQDIHTSTRSRNETASVYNVTIQHKRPALQPWSASRIASLPSSPSELLTKRLILIFGKMDSVYSWLAFVPSYCEESAMVLVAATALAERFEERHANNTGSFKSMRHYLKAISLLRGAHSLTSDAALLTAAILEVYDLLAEFRRGAAFSHNVGLGAMMRALPCESTVSDVARNLLYRDKQQRFITPCAQGIPSAFDDGRWVDVIPSVRDRVLAPEIVRLRVLTNRLFIQLPRLSAGIRHIRGQARYSSAVAVPDLSWSYGTSISYDFAAQDKANATKLVQKTADVLDTAMALLQVKDKDAEMKVLKRTRVSRTLNSFDEATIPFSYSFVDEYEFQTILEYWQARLLIASICISVDWIHKEVNRTGNDHDLECEQMRIAVNILMCWQSAVDSQYAYKFMPVALQIVWGAIFTSDSYTHKRLNGLRDWILSKEQELYSYPLRFSVEASDMDGAADIFMGGPIRGAFAKLWDPD